MVNRLRRRHGARKPHLAHVPQRIERLEERLVLSCPAEPITITGTAGNDVVLIESVAGSPLDIQFTLNGVTTGPCRPTQPITINTLGGNDSISAAADVYTPLVIDAGPGVDSVTGGSGDDTIIARDGEGDLIDGGLGFDMATTESPDRVANVERLNPIQDAPDNITQRVKILVLNYDPRIPSEGDRMLHEVFGWGDPVEQARGYERDLERASGGAIEFEIIDWRNLNEFPPQRDGQGNSFRYTPDEYVRNRRADSGWRAGAHLDYYAMFAEHSVAPLVDSGRVDEVWMFGDHFFLGAETAMAGPRSFYINGGTLPDVAVHRPFVVTSLGYHVGVGNMLHNTGHRTEATTNRIYGDWNLGHPVSNWDKFSANVTESNGKAGVGTTHFPANARHGYDTFNPAAVQSWADDYLNYPNLTFATTPISSASWSPGPNHDFEREYQNWYFGHFPRAAGVNADGKQNNWWKYLYDFDNYDETGRPKPPRIHATAADVVNFGDSRYQVHIAFSSPVPIDVDSFDGSDVTVTGPGGFTQSARFVVANDRNDGTYRVASYGITPPGGTWDEADRGLYTVTLGSNAVHDTLGRAMPGGIVAQFRVRDAAGVELEPESDTLLLLHFNGTTTGAGGETPLDATGVSFHDGIIGQAAHTANPGYIRFDTTDNIGASQGTIEFWLKRDGAIPPNQGFALFEAGDNFNNGLLLVTDSNFNLRTLMWGDDPNTPAVETDVERGDFIPGVHWRQGAWNHVAVTWDGPNHTLAMYLNGEQRAIETQSVSIGAFSGSYFSIGAEQFGEIPADASFDEFRISNRARSAAEIRAAYQAAIGYSGLAVEPPALEMKPGDRRILTATAAGSDGVQYDVAKLVRWTTTDPFHTTTFQSGETLAVASGTPIISATLGALSDSVQLSISDPSPPRAGWHETDLSLEFGTRTIDLPITYVDDTAVRGSSLGVDDVMLCSRNCLYPTSATIADASDGPERTVVYHFAPPRGYWTSSDSGQYRLQVMHYRVGDTSGNYEPSTDFIHFYYVQVRPPSAAATHFAVAAPAAATAGEPFEITVTALDAFGQVAADYRGTVRFTSTAAGQLPADSTLSNGVGTFMVTLETAGSRTIAARDLANGALEGTTQIIVEPAVADHVAFGTQPNHTQVGATIAPPVTVRVLDRFNNLVSDAVNVIDVSIATNPGGASLGGATNVAAVNGVATFANLSLDQIGTGYRLGAAADGLAEATSRTFNITMDAVPQATHFRISAPAIVTAGLPFDVTVTALDAAGQPTSGYAGTVHFTSSGNGTPPANSVLENGFGVFSWVLTTAGEQSITGTDVVLASITGSANLIVRPGAVAGVRFLTEPQDTPAGFVFTPPPTVGAFDAYDNLVADFSGTMQVVLLKAGHLPGELVGTTAVAIRGGVATFDNLAIDRPGRPYRLRAQFAGQQSGQGLGFSRLITITAPPVVTTHFDVAGPAIVTAGQPFVVTVTARDASNQIVTGYGGTVHVAGSGSATQPPDAMLTGGTGEFMTTLYTAGTQTVTATDRSQPSIMGTLRVEVRPGQAQRVEFAVPPRTVPVGGIMTPAVVVGVVDHFGNVVPDYDGSVRVALGSNPVGGMLGGATQLPVSSGTAVFSNLSIDRAGSGYTLVAASDGLGGATSIPFDVRDTMSAVRFVVTGPAVVTAGAEFELQVTAVDAVGGLAAGYSGQVAFDSSGSGVFPADAVQQAVSNYVVMMRGAGEHTITIRDEFVPGLTGSIRLLVHPAAAHHLSFGTELGTVQVGTAIEPPITVRVLDEFDNLITSSSAPITLSLDAHPSGGTLGGTATVAAVQGIATFGDLAVNRSGSGYVLRAKSQGLFGASTRAFSVRAAPGGRPLPNDPDTMLLLRFEDQLQGEAGEQPTASAGTSFTGGRVGRAAQFFPQGHVEYVEQDNIVGRAGTVEFWIRPSWYGSAGAARSLFQVGSESNNGMRLAIDASGVLRYEQWGDNPATRAREVQVARDLGFSVANWVPGGWHHVAATWDSRARGMTLYVDGEPVGTRGDAVVIKDFLGNAFQIGSGGSGSLSLDAALDEFRISSRARTAAEIRADYEAGGGGAHPCGDGTRLDINAMVAAGQAAVTGTPYDIGTYDVMFDHDTAIGHATRYRSANINPAVIRVAFQDPQTLEGFRVYFSHALGDPSYRWSVEAAGTVADLNTRSGSYVELVRGMETADDRYSTATLAAAATVHVVQLTAQRLTGDNFVHIDEFELIAAGSNCSSDTTPPVLANMPADQMLTVSTVTEAIVHYPMPTATDDRDPNPVVACMPPSGSQFPGGTTTVTCTARDNAGNSSSASFVVRVFDNTFPTVTGYELVGTTRGITEVIVHFSELLDVAAATNPANYELRNHGRDLRRGTADDQVYAVGTATYDAATNTVRLVPASTRRSRSPAALPHNQLIGLRVRDTVLDAAGNLLDGDNNGRAGDDFVASFGRGTALSYFDHDGDLITLALRGGGVFELLRREGGEATGLKLVDTNTARSILSGTLTRPRPPAQSNGVTTRPPITGSPVAQNQLLTNPAFVPAPGLAAMIDEVLRDAMRAGG